jgi:sugar fermentation stimulation protein A
MKFASSLVKGKLIQRYKRFLADVELPDGSIVTAHCANSGSMLGLKDPGNEVYLSPATTGKLKFRWEIVDVNGSLVGINTSLPNKLVEEALMNKAIPEFAAYDNIRREVKYGEASRVDFLLESPDLPPCYLEVKSVMTKRTSFAEFPDAVTARGTKHLVELANMVKDGSRAAMLYVAMRNDCESFALAEDIDPTYVKTSKIAFSSGVEKYCYQCHISLDEIRITKPMQFREG